MYCRQLRTQESDVPFFGVYGACSTIAESMSIGAMLVDGGFADNVVCITSSHFCSAEKQFRFPLEWDAKASFSPMDGNRLRRSVDFKRWFRPVYYTYYHRQNC